MIAADDLTDCRPLICSGRITYPEAVVLFRRFYEKYPRTDIRLLQYASETAQDSLPFVVRVLSAVSDGSRLATELTALFASSREPRLRAQLALFISRCHHDEEWVRRALRDREPRVRANVVEGIRGWCSDLSLLIGVLEDSHHRVVCNACVSLALSGRPEGRRKLRQLLTDSRWQFRSAACWAFSVVGSEDDIGPLERMHTDPHIRIRSNARKAIDAIRSRAESAAAAEAAPGNEAARNG